MPDGFERCQFLGASVGARPIQVERHSKPCEEKYQQVGAKLLVLQGLLGAACENKVKKAEIDAGQ